jgi:hypothetical protein
VDATQASLLDQSFEKALLAAGGTDRSNHETVVEYGVQMLFKGKNPKNAASATTKKLSGTENIFLGPGLSIVNANKLEENLWERLIDFASSGMKKMKAGFEHYSIDGTLQHFNQKPDLRSKLKEKIIAKLGHDPFVNDK